MITPVSLRLLGSFILDPVTGQFFVRLVGLLFWKWELSIGLDFKCNVLYKSTASKNIKFDINYVLKHTYVHRAPLTLIDEPDLRASEQS